MPSSRSLAPGLVLLAAGCYSYTPVTALPVGNATVVEARLSPAASASLATLLGPGAARVEGEVRAADDSSFTLGVTRLTRANNIEESWKGEPVQLLRRDVTTIAVRRFSAPRSVLLAAGLVGGSLLAGRAFGGGGEGATQTITPPPPAR